MESGRVAARGQRPVLLRLEDRAAEQLHRREHVDLALHAAGRLLRGDHFERRVVEHREALVELLALGEAARGEVAEARRRRRLLRLVDHVERAPVLLCEYVGLREAVDVIRLAVGQGDELVGEKDGILVEVLAE